MRSFAAVASSTMLVWGLVGCGGGGGGGGGLALPMTATTPAPAASVSVGGAKVSADASGAYAVKPGAAVSVQVGSDVAWTSKSEAAGAVTLQNPQAGNKTWSATLLHDGSSEDTFLLTARYGSGASDVLTLTFKVAAADARNGTYQMFSGAGAEFKFKVNFDLRQYVLQDRTGALIRPGTLVDDPDVAGTYVMVDALTKLAPSNNSRFRVNGDALIGALPVPMPSANPQDFNLFFPFVATRSVVTDKAALDGLYNRLDLTLTPGSGVASPSLGARLHEVQISGQGAVLDQCNEVNTISRLTSCAGTGRSLVRYTASSAADSDGHWTFINDVDANDRLVFAVARIGGENVLLEAGADSLVPANHVFRVGVPSAPSWAPATAYGGSVVGDWSKYSIGATAIDVSSRALDGSSGTESYPLTSPGITEPQGWRKAGLSTGFAFAMQGKGLYVLMGSSSMHNGYVHVGLLD